MLRQSNLDITIENANLDIEDDSSNHFAYYIRAGAYFEKAMFEVDNYRKSELYDKALTDYKQALIEAAAQDNRQVKYIIAKAKLLSVMGREKECVEDYDAS